MPGFGEMLQKAVYLGVGLASYAGEKAGSKLSELRTEAQKLADELVKRGEMTTEEARRFADDIVRQAQQQAPVESAEAKKTTGPRQIEIEVVEEDEKTASGSENQGVNQLRQEVLRLQDELRRLRQE